MTSDIVVTIEQARGAAEQQQALDAWRQRHRTDPDAVLGAIVEGGLWPLQSEQMRVDRLAPGCFCCAGFLPMQVTLIRMLRSIRPRAVLLLVVNADHMNDLAQRLRDGTIGIALQVETSE